jgi:hypothetical protein
VLQQVAGAAAAEEGTDVGHLRLHLHKSCARGPPPRWTRASRRFVACSSYRNVDSGNWIGLIIALGACSSYRFVDSGNLYGDPVKFVHTRFGARSVQGRRRW